METKLESLIQKIEKEAVDAAQAKADDLLSQARQEADKLVADARHESEQIVQDAQRQAEEYKTSGEAALQQAARDVELQLRERIEALFDRVFRREIGTSLDPAFLKELILRIAQSWAGGGVLEIAVGDADKASLESMLFAGLQEDLKSKISLTASGSAARGIRVGREGESVVYDFTDGAIADALREHLSPRLQQTLSGSDG